MKQTDAILAHLKAGYALTPIHALEFFGCFRLAARVAELKAAGHKIETRIVRDGDKRYAEYTLGGKE